MNRRAILVFHQSPADEARRKRLLSGGSWAQANRLLQANLRHTLSVAATVPNADVILCYDEDVPPGVDATVRCSPQFGHRLGDRMKNAAAHAVAAGYASIAVVGSDTPALSGRILSRSFAALEQADYCIGPSDDGGFFLLAFRAAEAPRLPILLGSLPWFTRDVLGHLLKRAASLRASCELLPSLADLDSWKDFARYPFERLWTSLAASVRVELWNERFGCALRFTRAFPPVLVPDLDHSAGRPAPPPFLAA